MPRPLLRQWEHDRSARGDTPYYTCAWKTDTSIKTDDVLTAGIQQTLS